MPAVKYSKTYHKSDCANVCTNQLVERNCIQSAFWHLFTATAHSPVGKNPKEFGIKITGPVFKGFAQNDLYHEDPLGADHPIYTKGLNQALNAYLNKTGYEKELQDWFDFPIPPTTHPKDLIENFLVQFRTITL